MKHKSEDKSPVAAQAAVNRTTLTVLKNSPWFRDVEDSLLGEIASLSTQHRYGQGEVIFTQGEPGDYLYGVVSGSVFR